MTTTVNYFLRSIKEGNASNFVDAIENMKPEQVESLTNFYTKEMDRVNGYGLIDKVSLISLDWIKDWAFENLRYDFQTVGNQSIKGDLVRREVYVCQSSLVDHLRKENFDSFEVENEMYYRVELSDGDEELNEEEKEEKLEELQELLENHEDNEPDQADFESYKGVLANADMERWQSEINRWEEEKEIIENDISALEDAEPEYRDIYEYWVVSGWFLRELENQGQCIVEFTETGDQWWGRCTTGQAILLDYVIGKIAFDMEILEFQANEWSSK